MLCYILYICVYVYNYIFVDVGMVDDMNKVCIKLCILSNGFA